MAANGIGPDPWKIESKSTKETALLWLRFAVGLFLAIGFRHFDGPGLTEKEIGEMQKAVAACGRHG